MAVSIAEIRDAAGAIAGRVKRTPSVDAPRLAELVGAERIVLKLESQQYTGSFKDRGALVKLLKSLDDKAIVFHEALGRWLGYLP